MHKRNRDLVKNFNQVVYFQSSNGYSLMVMKNRKQQVLDIPLSNIEDLLPPGSFYRIHRSFIVNLAAISELRHFRNGYYAGVHGKRIPVARRKRRDLLDSLDLV